MGAINIALFGLIPGMLILLTQIAWIPFWAAGVINGIGHFFGYRNYDVPRDASRNIVPWGILIGGEELHNNHHAYPASAKFSLEVVRVRHRLDVHPRARVARPRHGEEGGADAALRAAQGRSADLRDAARGDRQPLRRARRATPRRSSRTYAQELERLRHWSPREAEVLRSLKRALAARPAARRRRARAARRSAEELAALATAHRHAPRAGRALGALERLARSSCCAAAGLVPPRREQRHRAAGGFQRSACAATPRPSIRANKKGPRKRAFSFAGGAATSACLPCT